MSIFDEYRKKNRKEEESRSVENSLASFRDQNDRTKSLFQDKGYAEVTSNARAQINTSDSIRKFRENNIAQRDYEIAEREYMASLPNDAYRDAYTRSKDTDGIYVSPYFKTGTEGKEKLQYNNPEWNRLSEGEKKGYLEWAQQELEKESKKKRPNLERDNKYLNYAMSILNETDQTVRTIGDTHNISGNLFRAFVPDRIEDALGMNKESADTFNKDQELQIMLNMMPEEVRQYLNTGMVNLVREGQTLDTAEAIEEYLAKYYPPDVLEKLTKYARKVENIQKQQERNEDTERKMDNPFYASVVAPARQVGTDLLVKPVAGAIDFVRASSEANKGLYGEFDPLQTEAQRMAQDARYINQSILEGLQYGVDIPFTEDEKLEQFAGNAAQFSYNTSVSAAESAARMYLAGGLAKTMPFLNTETASKVLLTGMMSTAVFNDDLNENIQKGMPLEDAIGSAVAHSVFESLFEEVSLDKLGYFQDAPVLRSKKEFIKALGKAAFVEGSEEAFTDIANELYDHYVGNYDYSEYKAFADAYRASNPDATDAEVWWEFTKQFSWQVAQSFAGGALSSFALSSTKNMSALHRGETYIQNGKNVSDADYTRMNAFVEEMAAVNPNIANQLAEATEGGEDARRGFVKMVTDEYSNKFNKEIERADSKDKLNLVMNNVNSVMNGAISEDTFNTYNAKLVELGETPADYNTFVQNRKRGGETTFSDLAYGSGDNAIQRNIVEASKSIGEVQENANLSESERETAISNLVNKVNANLEKAEDLITRYTAMGKALDSPEIRQFESIMPLEKIAKIHSDAKADLGLVNAAQQLPAVKRSAVVKFADNDELHRVLGKDSVGHVSALTMNEIRSNSDYYATYHFAELLSRLTGAKYALFKSDRTDKQKNGAYDPNTDTTYIDVEAGKSGKSRATGGAFTHEFVHETRRKSEELYQRLKNFVQNDLGDSWNDFVQERMKPREEGGLGLDQNKAEEEVVAEACQRMLENSETFKKYALADYKGAKTFRDKLAEFVTRLKQMLKSVFKGDIDTRVTEAINDIEGLQKEFDQVLEEVIKMPSENDAESVKQSMEGKENIVEEMVKNADGEMEIAKMSDGTIMYSETTYRNGGRSAIANALKEKGHTQAEINKVVKYIDNRLNYIREIGLEFATKSFDKLAKNLEADITTDLATEAEILKRIEESGVLSQEVINNLRSAHQIAYAYVSNGDYPMNIDLQLSCKKRIAYEMIINRMIESGLMGDVRMSGEFIGEINTILAAHEFETQCLGCFVESRRLQMQKWAETFVSEWNQQVEKVTGKKRANATKDDYLFHGENAAGVDDAYAAHLQLEEAIKSGERNRAGNGGIVLKERSVFNKMGELIGFNKEFYGKFLTVEDILTADGLKKLRALDNGNLFSLVKSRYGVASPKILQSFNPYNSEVLNLTFKSVSEMTGNSVAGAQDYLNAAKKNLTAADTAEINRIIDENYDGKNLTKSQRDELLKEMTARKVENNAIRQYLLDIGGNRIQSFSDFMIENVFDMLQIFADMSVRDFAMHGYTKEQICLRLFGMTGAKWNGSWISHNLKEMGKELSGLMPYTAENAKHGITVEVDGEKYVIQFDDYERHVREKSFIQSIGFKDAIAIMLDPRYANNVGTITIGFSDKHIRAMLNSPYFRMVIPYHASGMIPGFAELVGASTYNDYTPYQTTGMNEIIVYENGTRKVLSAKEVKEKGEESVTKSSKGYKFTYKGTTYTVKPNMSFRFNEALQRLGDARAAAQEYVDWCRSEHALNIDGIDAYATFSPAFSNSPTGYDFTQEENYYKLLEDFNVYNSREEIINGTKVNARQEGVKLLYPGDEGGTLSAAELKQYEADLKQTGLFSDAEIQKYVKKAQMTFDELVRGEVSNRNAYYEGVFGKNNEKFNSAYEEIKQVSEKYKRNEQVAESKEQYLKSQEKAAKAKQNGNEKLLKAPAGTYLADENIRYSLRNGVEDEIKRIEASEGFLRGDITISDNVPDIMVGHEGVKNRPLVMDREHMRRNMLTEEEARGRNFNVTKKTHYHGVTSKTMIDVLKGLNDIDEAYRGTEKGGKKEIGRGTDYFLLVSKLSQGGNPITIPISINQDVNGYIRVNRISTVFGRRNFENYINEKIKDGYLVRITKKKASNSVNGSGTIPAGQQSDSFNNNIPQSQSDVKYAPRDFERSIEEINDDYMKAYESGNEQLMQSLVEEAARKAGYTVKAWHGSRFLFNSFDPNKRGSNTQTESSKRWFFAGDYDTANSYYPVGVIEELMKEHPEWYKQSDIDNLRKRGIAGKLYSLYLKMDNPLVVDVAGYDYAAHKQNKDAMLEYIEQAEREGRDGIILTHVRDNNLHPEAEESTVYMFKNPEQAKSADPVTYDDNGNVIPLTERFNDENTDIRFASRDIANSESEMIVNAMTNDAALVDELGAKQSITAYAKAYNEIQAMEKQSLQYSQQLLKASPSEREVLYKKLIRLNRAITNKTTELTEMRSQRVLRDVLINEWAKRLDDVEWTNELTYQRTKQALERKYGEEIVSLRAKSKAKQTEIRNRFEINKRKKNIETKAKALMKMILSPTEKKHIPSILINPITELLDSIDYWTPAEGRPTTKKSESLRTRFEDFRSAINEYQKQIDDGAEQIELMFDPEFLETVDDLCNSVKGIDNVNDMSVQDIIDLDHTLTELLHLISRGNKMIKAYHYQTINEAVEATAETMDKLDTLSSKTSAKGNLRMRLNAGMADSYAFGRYAGDGTKQIIDSLSKAFEDKVSKVKQAIEFTQEVLEPYKKDLKKWSKETHEFTLSTTDANGNPNKVSLTVGQMMELYLLNKREQARGHIYGGGIRVEDRKGRYTESVKVTEEDVQEIVNYLATVPGAIEVADKLQKYGATTITGWGNEASNLMYGFAKFTEPDYWQIRSDSSALKDNENTEAALNASMYRLQNMGRTKAVKKGANNAIYVGDVFDTWSKTIDEMTSYASILPSTTDAMRWWNSRIVNESGDAVRVKKLLESKLGTDMTRVFTETIKALNGGIMGTDSLESLVKVLTGKAKAAAVAGNLRVVLQQPTAYTRAAAVIEPKYLLKALTMKPNAKEAQEHSAIAWHKAQGFYSNGLAPSLRKLVIGDGSFGENLTEKSLWLAGKADDITWGALWNASKLKVEAENKALQKGSDAYWDEVNKVFSDIINNTQVVDTPLTKSTWMRGNGLGVFFTAFMAEPTKTYSMVMTAVEDLVRNPKSKAAQKSVALVGTVFAVNAAVNALAQALADAARDDNKDKSYWEKYVEKYTEDIKDNLNPLTYIPVVKDIFSLMQGYSNNNLAMQAAQNTVYAVQELQKIAKGTSKKTLFGQMETVAKAVSGWTGIPFGNVMRTLNSFGNIVGIDTFRRKKYTNSELGRNIALSINEGNFEEADQYMAELLQNVNGDEKKAQNYLVTYLAENDNEIDLWTTRYIEDPTVMDDAVSAMSDKYSADVIMSAIRKSANAQGEEVGSKSLANGTSVYTGNDINRTLEKGDVQKAQEMIDDVNKAYAAAGSNSTAKSTITTYWKPKYLAASGAERDRILRMLYSLRSNGKQMYTAKEIAKWK